MTVVLERAAQLLEARAGSVAEIAYSVGFKGGGAVRARRAQLSARCT